MVVGETHHFRKPPSIPFHSCFHFRPSFPWWLYPPRRVDRFERNAWDSSTRLELEARRPAGERFDKTCCWKKSGEAQMLKYPYLGGGWTNPFEKYESNWIISPRSGVKIKKIFETTNQISYIFREFTGGSTKSGHKFPYSLYWVVKSIGPRNLWKASRFCAQKGHIYLEDGLPRLGEVVILITPIYIEAMEKPFDPLYWLVNRDSYNDLL